MHITYTSHHYKSEEVTARYLRKRIDGTYIWCEVGKNRRYDVRQGTVAAHELPDAVRMAADENKSVHYVDWPL